MSADTMATGHDLPRRDFLKLVTVATAAIGGAALAWSLIDTMNPAADVIAAGAPMDIDLSKIAAGQQVIVRWRGTPILIVNRTQAALKMLQDPALVGKLSDPESSVHQQPSYAENWHRSIEPEFAVLVGICTPSRRQRCHPTSCRSRILDPGAELARRLFLSLPWLEIRPGGAGSISGVPAPYNLPVPPYHFPTKTTVRIGENPPGQVAFELESVVQM